MSTHTTILNHSFDGDNDVELEITYTYTPGQRERGPTYFCAGEPAVEPEVEVLSVIVKPEYADAHNATEDEFDMVVCCERLWQKLCDHAESNL